MKRRMAASLLMQITTAWAVIAMTIIASEAWYPRIPFCVVCSHLPMLLYKRKMEDIKEKIKFIRDCTEMRKPDLFNIAIIRDLEDFERYLNQRDEKEKKLNELISQQQESDNIMSSLVSEPHRYTDDRLTLERIIEYAESLKYNEDFKTIQIMLFSLLGCNCSPVEMNMICNMKAMGNETVINNFYDKSQNVNTIKKQIQNNG